MKRIKDILPRILAFLRSETAIFASPAIAFALLAGIQRNILAFVALILWIAVIIANANEKE